MTSHQQSLLSDIEKLKAQLPNANKSDRDRIQKQLKKLAHWLTQDDAREHELKFGRRNDPGGRSRSPSMGRFSCDDERQYS